MPNEPILGRLATRELDGPQERLFEKSQKLGAGTFGPEFNREVNDSHAGICLRR
jgi:hypothetical protein